MSVDLKNIFATHFIGIGGIGVSSIARMFLLQGKRVSGSDVSSSKTTEELEKLGARIFERHDAKNIPENIDLVIYTIAIPGDNPEFLEAKKRGLPMLSYPELLGLISKDKYTIAVSGTHGKTTTTAMIAKVLIEAQLDPTVIVGSFLKGLDPSTGSGQESNFIAGKSNYFVVEACEYRRSFLNINPKIIIITNIDNDHLDYYKDIADIQNAFREFISKLPEDGIVVCNPNDPLVRPVVANAGVKIIDYSLYSATPLSVPGAHNISNAKAAEGVGEILGIDKNKIASALLGFKGTWRRSEYKGKTHTGVEVYDDYAHHPTEIKATLKAFREKFPRKHIIVLFQPHLYSRTKLLLSDFAESFGEADKVFILPIYAAREALDPSISNKVLAQTINASKHRPTIALEVSDFVEARKTLENHSGEGDILITIGAGDVYKIGELLLN